MFTVSLPLNDVLEAAGRIGGTRAQATLLRSEARRCSEADLVKLRTGLLRLGESLCRSNTNTTPSHLAPIVEDLCRRVAEAWIGGIAGDWQRTTRSRAKVIRSAQDVIHGRAAEPLTVMELCQQTGVSERTLEYAFQERFGVSPKRYLMMYRFHGVRRALRQSDPSATKIADVANTWGFWHMGQFAADYRKLFSELPSQTLHAG